MPFGYKEIPLEQVVANPYTASPQEIHDGIVLYRVNEHYQEALEHFPREQIVGCFLQGSQNYGLDYEGSDVDTKLIVVPSFKDICLNRKPVSTTHVRANDEHTDWKDVRLYSAAVQQYGCLREQGERQMWLSDAAYCGRFR